MTNPQISAFLIAMVSEIGRMTQSSHMSNLTVQQQQALTSLHRRQDTVIKPSDKGGNIVLMTQEQYETMCHNILNNSERYRRIPMETVAQFEQEYKQLIYTAYMDTLIDQKTHEFHNISFPGEPIFYTIPKIHKNLEIPPGRPIESGIGAITENASTFVDFFPHAPCHQTPFLRQGHTGLT